MLSAIMFYLPIIAIACIFIFSRGKYKNKSNAGAFFFENDCLVLNTGVPYAIPFSQIDCVELQYSPKELERKLSYGLWVKVIKIDGKSKRVFYKGYRTAELALPSDMQTALEEKGIRVVMVEK